MILTIFKILKIHYKHFRMEFLYKYTLVYRKYVLVKTCIVQKSYLHSKSIDNWLISIWHKFFWKIPLNRF